MIYGAVLTMFLMGLCSFLSANDVPNYGAQNAGNSCFLNSCVQALFHANSIKSFLTDAEKKGIYQEGSVAKRLMQHLRNLDGTRATKKGLEEAMVRKFREGIATVAQERGKALYGEEGKEFYFPEVQAMNGRGQHDAQELLGYLTQSLLDEIKIDSTLDSKVDDIFGLSSKSDEEKMLVHDTWEGIKGENNPGAMYDANYLRDRFGKKIYSACEGVVFADAFNDIIDKANNTNFSVLLEKIIAYKKYALEEYQETSLLNNFFKGLPDNEQLEFIKFLSEVKQIAKEKKSFTQIKDKFTASLNKVAKKEKLLSINRNQEDKLYYFLAKLIEISPVHIKLKKEQCDQLPLNLASVNLTPLAEGLNRLNKLKNACRDVFFITVKDTKSDAKSHSRATEELVFPFQLEVKDSKDKVPLTDLLNSYTQREKLEEIFRWNCDDGCDRTVQTFKEIKIKKLPQLLVLQLKRFKGGFNGNGKINTPVTFPPFLDMRPYLSDDSAEKYTRYLLSSIVIHGGGIGGGHYWAYARSGNQWFGYNDAVVTSKSENEMIKIFTQEDESGGPYLLFYEREGKPVPEALKELSDSLAALKKRLEVLAKKLQELKEKLEKI